MLGYPSNIHGYPSKYWNYTSKKKLGWFPDSPQWIIFLIFISQKILLNIKDVEFDFRMDCIHVLFPFSWIINMQFTNFNFFYFQILHIGLLWSKITSFIIQISLKLHLHTSGWNNPNWGRLGLKSPKFQFFLFLTAQKFIANTNIQIHFTLSIFTAIFFVKMLVTMPSIRINDNWNYQKNC